MANEVGGHELVRWAYALGGAVLAHGALLLGSSADQVRAVQPDLPALVWLDAAVEQRAAEETAGLSVSVHPPSSPAPRLSKQRAKLNKQRLEPAKPSPGPSSESAPLPAAASSGSEAQALLPQAAEPAGTADEIAATGAPVWGEGSLAGTAGGGGSGGGSATSEKPSFPPGLMAFGDPCRGYYPSAADVDHGEVRVVVRVGSDGSTRGSEVVAEVPARQGFGPAARACVSRLRFRPARDAWGGAIPGRAVLALSFDRS
jgi:outer membrane biosynthesis protein TonB